MRPTVSIAIETSCRLGGLALGRGDELVETVNFDASSRHATLLISQLDALLGRAGLRPTDLDEVYVSLGPGSFTGIRVGVTVARTLGQTVAGLRCVAVPTARAVVERIRDRDWQTAAVILDAREGLIHASTYRRQNGRLVPAGEPVVTTPTQFGQAAPRPVLLTGEGLAYHDLADEGVELAGEEERLPTAEAVWRVGHSLARDGQFTPVGQLLPIYTRKPKALRQQQIGGR